MKILFISQFLPYPPYTGGKIKTGSVLRILAKKNEVFFVGFVDKKEDLVYIKDLKKVCKEAKVFVQPIITQAHQNLKAKAFSSLFSSKPFRVYKHYSSSLKLYLKKIMARNDFDAIWIDQDVMMQYTDNFSFNNKEKKPILVYDEHDISSLATWRNFLIERKLLEKLAYFLEMVKWYFYEKKYLPRFDYVFAISETDKKKFIKMGVSPKKISFLPIPVLPKSLFKFNHERKNILFVGLMSWKPNEDGFWWFYKEVFPKVKKKISGVTFVAIGDHPSAQMKRLQLEDKQVKVLGYVKDLTPYFREASVFIVPIRSGGGIRVKILDTLARGVPIVSTTLGKEGIGVKNGEELLVADEPQHFAQAVVRILQEEKLANNLSVKGIEFISKNYQQGVTEKILKKSGFFS